MQLHEFLVSPAETARRKGPHDRIVMSSRVRLARNSRPARFPAGPKNPSDPRHGVNPARGGSLPELEGAFSETMDNLSALDKQPR
jgi:hypothetical protein